MVPTNISYDDILERHGGAGGIPDPSHLTTMAKDLKQLSELASARSETCNAGMRALSEKRKEALDEERQREQEARAREAEERETLKTLKKEAEEEDDEIRGRKVGKPKKKKERSSVREERPLAHGAHGLARQDGLDLPLKGTLVIYWPFTEHILLQHIILHFEPKTLIVHHSNLVSPHQQFWLATYTLDDVVPLHSSLAIRSGILRGCILWLPTREGDLDRKNAHLK